MQTLDRYPKAIGLKITAMGDTAMTIAERWMNNWPERVEALIKANQFLRVFREAVDAETKALAEMPVTMERTAVFELWGIRPDPPMPETVKDDEAQETSQD